MFSANGTLRCQRFDDIYASAEGALAQARHVFLNGNLLPERWRKAGRFTIVETGFGAGLNFLSAWRAFREEAASGARLHYVSVDKHPFAAAALGGVHERFPELQAMASALRERYPPLLPGMHRLHFDDARVSLTLLFGDVVDMLRQLRARADAYFLDGFAPARNPEMWSAAVFAELARMANPGATFATYTVAASVVRGLADAGFSVEKHPGFARKRDMLCGRFTRAAPADAAREEKRAIIVGAGLAGTSCAQRLAERGWNVQLLERHPAVAAEASGNPAGLVRPVFSLDWNTHSRFTTAAFLYACRHQAALDAAGTAMVRGRGGVLQLARDASHFDKQRRIIDRFGMQADLVKVLPPSEAAQVAGTPVAGPACWFPAAMWADPASMCRANLDAAGGLVQCLFGSDVGALRRTAGGWDVLDGAGGLLASAPVVVLANAGMATRFAQAAWLPLRPVRGQVSLLRERPGRELKVAVCREGYVTPALNGAHCIGATFNEDTPEPQERREDHAANLRRLDAMLPGFGEGVTADALDGRVAFRTMSFDRLPVLGALPDAQSPPVGDDSGLHACLALGSRGMTWAALAAEIVASRIEGDPMPVEAGLLDVLDPLRFMQRARSETPSRRHAPRARRIER